jgi:hypothetical protein
LTSGCGSSTPTALSPAVTVSVAPNPVPSPGPLPTYTLTGIVFEVTATGRVPVDGVEVYCDSCGSPTGHTFASTDAQGSYSFGWAHNGVHPLLVRKAGYDVKDPAGTFPDGTGVRNAIVNGDTRFDIELLRR